MHWKFGLRSFGSIRSFRSLSTELFRSAIGWNNESIEQISGSERKNFLYLERERPIPRVVTSIFRSGIEMVVSRPVYGFYSLFLYESHIVLLDFKALLRTRGSEFLVLHNTFIFFNKTVMIQSKKLGFLLPHNFKNYDSYFEVLTKHQSNWNI